MTDLERLRAWLKTYDGLPGDYLVDYTDKIAGKHSVSPSGMVELHRGEDILGNIKCKCQYNFAIYWTFPKSAGDRSGVDNQEWLMQFQRWVQQQSARGLAPTFGNVEQGREIMRAQNGMHMASTSEGVGLYSVQLSANFTMKY